MPNTIRRVGERLEHHCLRAADACAVVLADAAQAANRLVTTVADSLTEALWRAAGAALAHHRNRQARAALAYYRNRQAGAALAHGRNRQAGVALGHRRNRPVRAVLSRMRMVSRARALLRVRALWCMWALSRIRALLPTSVWRTPTGITTALCAIAGLCLLTAAATMQPPRPPQPPPPPPTASPMVAPSASPTSSPPTAPGNRRPSLPRSEPTEVEIPAIAVRASLLSLGVTSTNELAVPPLDRAELAAWWNRGPAPGEAGSAIIVGHVDSHRLGPAVFFHLGKLKPGDAIVVHRKDGRSVRFKVDSVAAYPKASFPADLVYAHGNGATLRLITCGGEFDRKARDYLSNVVVFATYEP